MLHVPPPLAAHSASVLQVANPRPSACVTPSQYLSIGPASQSPSLPHTVSAHWFGRAPAPPVAVHVPAPAAWHCASELQPSVPSPAHTLHGQSNAWYGELHGSV